MAIARHSTITPPPALWDEVKGEPAPKGKTEIGFTLQTLIVTAVLVLVAVGASIGLVAITTSSSDDFEDAGQTGVEARCAPNEVRDPDLEARGAKGVNQTYREIQADTIGCNPICGTWEYFNPGRSAAGSGGPEGNGGTYSTDAGCFAPCYWNFGGTRAHPKPEDVKANYSSLAYYDDNRFPVAQQVRLGVAHSRYAPPLRTSTNDLWYQSDLGPPSGIGGNKDDKPFIWTYDNVQNGSLRFPGKPLTSEQIAVGIPPVFKPNLKATGTDPGGTERNKNNSRWEEENWEYRADPVNKVCTIVNITLDDQVVCSSEWENCASRG